MAIPGNRSEASLRYFIGHPSSEQLRACSNTISDALTGRPHQSQQPSFMMLSFRARAISCSSVFCCRSFIKHTPRSVCFLIVYEKTYEFSWEFGRISLKISLFTLHCQLLPIEFWWFVNFDGLSFLTALVLFNQSDYLNHSNKDPD